MWKIQVVLVDSDGKRSARLFVSRRAERAHAIDDVKESLLKLGYSEAAAFAALVQGRVSWFNTDTVLASTVKLNSKVDK